VHILFICTGNTCRSPMAAFLAKSSLSARQLDWRVSSAGLHAVHGQPMADAAVNAMIRRHVVVEAHASQPLTEQLAEQADVIFTMTAGHREALIKHFPQLAYKIHNLISFAMHGREPEGLSCDIVDPFGGSDETYEACATVLQQTIERTIDKLQQPQEDIQ